MLIIMVEQLSKARFPGGTKETSKVSWCERSKSLMHIMCCSPAENFQEKEIWLCNPLARKVSWQWSSLSGCCCNSCAGKAM